MISINPLTEKVSPWQPDAHRYRNALFFFLTIATLMLCHHPLASSFKAMLENYEMKFDLKVNKSKLCHSFCISDSKLIRTYMEPFHSSELWLSYQNSNAMVSL